MRLELDRVTAAYGDTIALRDVDLTVPTGSVVALLGPNGAGKTTLLSVASGLLRPRSGRVLLDDEDQTDTPPDGRVERGLCHITEGRSVFPGLTVADNLRMFAPPQRAKKAVERAVDAFPRLGERLGQLAGTMSGGEQQMLALSRAYAQQAPLIMLDEVSMGLAPIIVDEIFEFLGRLAAEGQSLLIVEQYVAKALALADFVYVLVRGRLVFAGEPGEADDGAILGHYLGAAAAG
ncbi:MAG: ABC transporter ATP-binding protein [Actinobacteria bacterium]|nr:MAG: ABC transporter ATP-binding protein [Actinomycetota bacterium]HKN89400.1 ABC transporter ATP-binding protein [Acidimicrobiia bacterium]HMC79492.1 ABC transporter ATP-binding protein [Acidimicrobiia bacterium]